MSGVIFIIFLTLWFTHTLEGIKWSNFHTRNIEAEGGDRVKHITKIIIINFKTQQSLCERRKTEKVSSTGIYLAIHEKQLRNRQTNK